MSRRRRGRPQHHAPAGTEAPRRPNGQSAGSRAGETPRLRTATTAASETDTSPRTLAAAPSVPGRLEQAAPRPAVSEAEPAPPDATKADPVAPPSTAATERLGQCTAPQLRRFIKSRPYVPMHELRRRFAINGEDDDVTGVRLEPGMVYLGLPDYEGRLLGDLLRTGEIGYELSLDPRSPIVIGVYPMRPIPRP